MKNLENAIEIATAIINQKRSVKDFLPEVDLSEKTPLDLKARLKEETQEKTIQKLAEDFEFSIKEQKEKDLRKISEEEKSYDMFQKFAEYISLAKSKFYEYYSAVKDGAKAVQDALKIGYTDKLLNEIEDWGVIYFKTAFDNIKRISPLGAAYRYLQKLWICVSKKAK